VQCLDDLKAPDYQWFRESKVRTAVHGTFDHLVEEPQLSIWKSRPESCLLWVRGRPGCGKTTFAKFVLEGLEKEIIDTQDANNTTQGRTAVLYFFFYGQDEDCSTELGLLRALIDQLLMADSNLYQHILPHYQKLSTKFSEESETLWSIFTAMVLNRGFSTIYCIIDAFDECETGTGLNDYHPTLEKIKRLVGKKYRNGNILKFLVTSRPTSAMAASMYDFPVMTIEPRREAIDLFIDSETVVLPDNIRQLVRLSLKGKSGKSFLWVSIITRRIRRMNKHQLKPKKLQDFIERLPTELNRTYDSIFGRIMEEMRPLLLWILYSPRSMTMKQLEEALATEPDCKSASKLSEYRVDLSIDGLEADSEGLIEVNTDRRSRFRVSFVHQTVKEFLLDTRLLSSEETTDTAQIYLAKTCLTYLNFDDFAQRPLNQTVREKTFPLYKPAAENWFRFVHQAVREEKAQLSTELMELVDPLLELESTTSKTWRDQLGRRLVAVQYPSDLAIELDVDWLLSYILKGETDRITNELSSTAFQKAAQNFDTRILHLLFEHNLSKDGTLPSDMEDMLLSAVRNERCGRDLITLIQQYYQHFTASEKVVLEALGNYTFGKDVIHTLLETNPSLEITNSMIEAAVRSGTHNRVTGSDLLSVFGSPDAIHNLPVGPLMWSPPDPILQPHPENEALEYLLTSPRNPGVGISEEDLVNAVKNAHLGDRTLASLLSPRARDITITPAVRETAARNGKCGLQLVQLLLNFKPFRLDEPFLVAAASNRKQGEAMFKMFCERKLNFDLSETVLLVAAKEGSIALMRFLLQHTSNSIIDDQLLIAACLNSNMGRTLELLLNTESTFELSESTKQQLVIAAKHNRWAGNLVLKLLVTHFQSLEVDKDVADALCFLAGPEPELLDMFLSNVVANFSEDAIEVMRADYQHEIVPCLLEQPLLAEIIESLETGIVDDEDEDEDEDSDIDAELEGKEELEEPAWRSVPYKPVMETLYCLTRTAGEIQAIKHGYCGTDDDVNVQVTVVASDAETRVSKRIKLN
jgi:ankyrin repeat protein